MNSLRFKINIFHSDNTIDKDNIFSVVEKEYILD